MVFLPARVFAAVADVTGLPDADVELPSVCFADLVVRCLCPVLGSHWSLPGTAADLKDLVWFPNYNFKPAVTGCSCKTTSNYLVK